MRTRSPCLRLHSVTLALSKASLFIIWLFHYSLYLAASQLIRVTTWYEHGLNFNTHAAGSYLLCCSRGEPESRTVYPHTKLSGALLTLPFAHWWHNPSISLTYFYNDSYNLTICVSMKVCTMIEHTITLCSRVAVLWKYMWRECYR